jgi:FkbM family methyltransferase
MLDHFIKFLPYNVRESFFWRFLSKHASTRKNLYIKKSLVFGKEIQMNLSSEDICHQIIAHAGFFELHLSKVISNLAKDGGVFVDIGANYGYYSLIWASYLKSNKVYALEAFRPNYYALKRNVLFNNLENQIYCQNIAISNRNEVLFWDVKDKNQNTWGGLSKDKNLNDEIITHSLDTIFKKNIEIAVLKVDVEGAESLVFEGAKRLLSCGCIKNIAFEINDEREKELGIKPGKTTSILTKFGYSIRNMNPNRAGVSEHFAVLK